MSGNDAKLAGPLWWLGMLLPPLFYFILNLLPPVVLGEFGMFVPIALGWAFCLWAALTRAVPRSTKLKGLGWTVLLLVLVQLPLLVFIIVFGAVGER